MNKFFGEVAYYDESDGEEKMKATEYLNYWKKNLISKLNRDSFAVKVIDEQWVERPAVFSSCLQPRASLALKLCLESDFNYELK